MIDLTKAGIKPLELKLSDDEIIELESLSLKETKKLDELRVSGEYENLLKCLYMILNKNKQGKKFTSAYIESLGTKVCRIILAEYIKWIYEAEKN